MKVIQLSEHIFKLEFWCGLTISTWIVKDKNNVYLIDTGMAHMVNKQLAFARKLGEVKAIFLTHGHSDHIGGCEKIVKKLEVPVYAHQRELNYINNEVPYPGRKKIENTKLKGKVNPLTIDNNHILHNCSSIQAFLTPGHSPGHVAYYHRDDNVFIAGDLFREKKGDLYPPFKKFTANMDENIRSGKIVEEINPAILTTCHSGEVENAAEKYKNYFTNYS